MWLLLVLLPLLCVGCSPWEIKYEPRSVRQSDDRLARKALRIGVDDLQTLADADGKPIGTLDVDVAAGWALTGGIDEVHEKAQEEAAKRGASHFFYLESKESVGAVAVANKVFGATVVTAHETRELRGGRYLLIRVPEKSWKQLDSALRPEPLF